MNPTRYLLAWAVITASLGCSMIQTRPMLQSFEGKRFTICCENHPQKLTSCGREAWVEAIRTHCRGGAKAYAGSTGERNVGVHVEATEPMYPGDGGSLDVVNMDSTKQCVNYECTVNVTP